MKRFFVTLAAIALLFAPGASAQQGTGELRGRVVDAQNARLITIEASGPERPDRMPVGQAYALAKAIARLGDRRR